MLVAGQPTTTTALTQCRAPSLVRFLERERERERVYFRKDALSRCVAMPATCRALDCSCSYPKESAVSRKGERERACEEAGSESTLVACYVTLRYALTFTYSEGKLALSKFEYSNYDCAPPVSNSPVPGCGFPLLFGVLDQIPLLCLCELCVCLAAESVWVLLGMDTGWLSLSVFLRLSSRDCLHVLVSWFAFNFYANKPCYEFSFVVHMEYE